MQADGESILIVDDNSEVLSALELELSEYFNVTTLLSAKQALALLQNQSFAAIISDVRMPEIDGLTLIKECAAKYPDMVRILLTAFDDEEVQETALSSFGAYKMSKPWDDDLVVTVQNALNQRNSKMELRKSIDLGKAAMELDKRLHLELKPEELIPAIASELFRVKEVKCISVYEFDEEGVPSLPQHLGSETTQTFPELTTRRDAPPEKDGEYYNYTVAVGEWPSPAAAFVLRLTSANEDNLQYFNFVGRQAYRALLLINPTIRQAALGNSILIASEKGNKKDNTATLVSTAGLVEKLSTQSTVVVSAAESLRDIQSDVGDANIQNELKEIASDLDTVYSEVGNILKKIQNN
jgi:CheY-like chemotaxis protein